MDFEISVYDGFQVSDGKSMRIADVRAREEGKRARTWIKLVGDDDAGLFASMALWAENGCPAQAELKV